MRKWAAALAAAFAAAALAGCSASNEGSGTVLWFAGDTAEWNSATTAVVPAPYRGKTDSVDSLMAALLAGPPANQEMYSPIPEGTRLLGWQLEDGLLWLDLSEHYARLTGFELTLADYCIALTLSQVEGVERVSITSSGASLSYRQYGELARSQVIFSGVEEEPVEVTAALYFPRAAGRGLGFETRAFLLMENETLEERVAQALAEGPESRTLSAALPEGAALLGVRMEDGVCYADFSEGFVSGAPADEEQQANVVYSVVNTLGNLPGVAAVRILVEGEVLERYGALPLPAPIEPDFGLSKDG